MINENTVRQLNSKAFGADISKLEAYIVDIELASKVADTRKYKHNYKKLVSILKEVKSNSKALTNINELERVELNQFDSLFQQELNIRPRVVYNIDNLDLLEDIKDDIYRTRNSVDALAIIKVSGIDFKATYINGKLYRIELVGEKDKYNNVTDELSNKLPTSIEMFKYHRMVEVRGEITLHNEFNNKYKMLNSVSYIMRCLRNKVELDKLTLYVTDVFTGIGEKVLFENNMDKLENLRDLEFNIPEFMLIRNVNRESLSEAVKSFCTEFEELNEENEFDYEYSSIIIKDNNIMSSKAVLFEYNSLDTEDDQLFESTVTAIDVGDLNEISVRVVSVECNRRCVIKNIIVDDICDLDTFDVDIGKTVKFIVVEGKAELVR